MPIAPEVYESMGLNKGEYELITELLGREPSLVELGMFSVMWSEHCGYKYSREILAKFGEYKKAIEGEGLENAGVVDIGGGLGATFKVESHNHPSAVEPYQGAATGVGGIIRDVLTMGARPIAMLNSLRFGPIHGDDSDPIIARNRHLLEHVVEGIAGYGNCVGVPTVAGEVQCHPRYSGNPLVNAMCVGIVPLDEVTTAAAQGEGNAVLYFGSATGRDGIHGATFASTELDADSEAKRPNVQIGDPFAEKLLIEATLELLQTGTVVAIQDMGAAGLTCSTTEMASKGNVGMTVDLDLVPMRESDMEAYELMLSESQERMMAVVAKGREEEALAVLKKWGVPAAVVGRVTEEPRLVITRNGETVCDLDPRLLTDHCPAYHTEPEAKPKPETSGKTDLTTENVGLHQALLDLLAHPNVADKEYVYRQFDQQVQTQTVVAFGDGDAAVLAPRGTEKGIAVTLDGTARWVECDPYVGAQWVFAEAARNVACTGARPVAATDGLNWGSPQDPQVFWSFERAVTGLAEAADALRTPVLSGNVSFYNESELGAILPTPMIGVLGVIADPAKALASAPKGVTNLFLVSVSSEKSANLAGSLVNEIYDGAEIGDMTSVDLAGERRLHDFLVQGAEEGTLTCAHDLSDGGFAVALAEICVKSGHGVHAEGDFSFGQAFSEDPGRVIVGADDLDALENLVQAHGLHSTPIGQLEERAPLRIGECAWSLGDLERAYRNAWPLGQ